jgi:hypothetical protein
LIFSVHAEALEAFRTFFQQPVSLVNGSRLKRFEDPLAISSLANEKYPKAAGA